MIGYLVVLPNAKYSPVTTTQTTTGGSSATSAVMMLPGAGSNQSSNGFSPANIKVVVGVNNTVAWTNGDSADHTVTTTSVPVGASSFDSGAIAPGTSFQYTFTVPGVYQYHCLIHPWMTGTVTVLAAQ